MPRSRKIQRLIHILTLIIAGEMIFSLPFHTGRFFRPTLLEAFNFSNTQLGDLFAVYGIMAMLAYFPGGAVADRFEPRKLMSISLWATAGGGVYMASFPDAKAMAVLYGFWGITTIFLFWAALLRATREWGGDYSQGTAFGILEGGRGLAAAGFALVAVAAFSFYLPADAALVGDSERKEGFRTVILLYSAATAAAGVLTWIFLPASQGRTTARGNLSSGIKAVMLRPVVWAHAAVIACAYCGYKGLDNYSLYAVQVLGMDEVEAARFTAIASYLRPVAAVTAGILADRFSASKTIGITFLLMLISYLLLAVAIPSGHWLNLIYANLFISFFAVFALRGVYFALLKETATPRHLTGTTIGVVSLAGFTPEIFFAPIAGRILDHSPGLQGHQNYFWFLAGVALLGLIAISTLAWLNRRSLHD
jgi:nitrate/nitrite transporter NarK